jgi:uncharacterized protein (DUF302 family)
MSIKVMESSKSVAEIARAFPEVCAKYKFGVLGSIDLRQKLQEKGLVFDRECLVFEVCNPQAAKQVLDDGHFRRPALPHLDLSGKRQNLDGLHLAHRPAQHIS